MAILDDLGDLAQHTLDAVGKVIFDFISKIETFLRDIINTVIQFFQDAISKIIEEIEAVFNSVVTVISDFTNSILESITDIVNDTIQFISNLIDDIINGITGFIDSALTFLSDVFDTIVNNITEIAQDVSDLFVEIFDNVKLNIELLIDSVIVELTELFDTIKAGVGVIIDKATQVIASVVEGVDTFIREVVDVVGNSLRDLLETISNLPDTITSLADRLIESAEINIGEKITGLPMQIINDLLETLGGSVANEADTMRLEALDSIFGKSPVAQTPEAMREAFTNFMPENPILKMIVTIIVAPLMILQVYSGIASANSEIVLQEHALVNPYRLMPPPDIIVAKRFDRIEQSLAVEWLRKTGYTESVANILLETSIFTIPPTELVSWWLREIIDDNTFDVGLARQGWTEQDIARLRIAAFFIPPVADLITMSVREVFTPDVAQRFGQFDDFPDRFLVEAKKQGLSEEWAKNYWAAHWALPSVNMGFEMLHRGVIDEADLSLLLRATDVMPFWRDKLIQISFSPLTRVDIRRMHKVGVLTEAEVNKAYHDIGYNDLNADRLTAFTLELNGATGADDELNLSELTRSNVISFFKDGVLDKQSAIDVLISTGISPEVADLFILQIELQLEADFRRDEISLIIEQVKGGVIDFDQAQDALNQLGLEELEKQKATNKVLREQAKRNKIPPKADLDKMLKKKIIAVDEYVDNIKRLGFSDQWADRYKILIGVS